MTPDYPTVFTHKERKQAARILAQHESGQRYVSIDIRDLLRKIANDEESAVENWTREVNRRFAEYLAKHAAKPTPITERRKANDT